ELLNRFTEDEDLYEYLSELQLRECLAEEALQTVEALLSRTKDPYLSVLRTLRKGDIYQRQDQTERALETYAGTLPRVGADTWLEREILRQIAELFRKKDRLTDLASFYEKLTRESPRRLSFLKAQSQLLARTGKTEEAIAAYEKILDLTPGDRAHREGFLDLLQELNQPERAVTQLEKLLSQHPDDQELLLRLARLENEVGQPDRARATIERYLAAAGSSEYAYLRTARLLEEFDLPAEAESTYEKLCRKYPDSEASAEARASFLHRIEKREEAIALWQKLAKGKDRDSLLRIAKSLTKHKEMEAAFELLKSRLGDFGKDPAFLNQIGSCALAVEQFSEGIPWARQRLNLAETGNEMEAAMTQLLALTTRAEQMADLMKDLSSLDSRTPAEACLLAELLEQDGEQEAADQAIAPLFQKGHPLAAHQRIRLQRHRRNWAEAAKTAIQLFSLPNGRKSANAQKAVEFFKQAGQPDKALEWIPEWKKLSPGSTQPWFTEARIFMEQGKNRQAIAVLRQASQQFEDQDDVTALLADAYADAGQDANAERLYRQLYENTEDTSVRLGYVSDLALLAEKQGKQSRLIEQFEERRQNNRQSILPLLALAEIHRVFSNYEERRKALMEASRIKPDDLNLLQAIARVEEAEGDWERAIETLAAASRIDKTTRTREQIARIHLSNGNEDKGFQLLEEIANETKDDAKTVENLTLTILSNRDWQRGVEYLAPRLEAFPDDYRLHYALALAQEELGLSSEAIEVFLKVLELEETPLPTRSGLGPRQRPALSGVYAHLPPDARFVLGLRRASTKAYQHHQNRRRSTLNFRLPTNLVFLPTSRDEARTLATFHLLKMSLTLDSEDLGSLEKSMAQRGVPDPDLLIRLTAFDQNLYRIPSDALDQNTRNLNLLALLSYNSFDPFSFSPASLEEAFSYLKSTQPELALTFCLKIAEKIPAQWLAPAVELLAEQEPTTRSFYAVASLYKNRFGPHAAFEDDLEQPQPLRSQLRDQFFKWYHHLSNSDSVSPSVRSSLLRYAADALIECDPFSEALSFLDEELIRLEKADRKGSLSAVPPRRRNQPLIPYVKFPPASLPGPLTQILNLLQNQSSRLFPKLSGNAGPEEVAAINHPVLRLLLAHGLAHEEVADRTISNIEGDSDANLTELLAVALYLKNEENGDKASTFLQRATNLPMKSPMREYLDALLVRCAIDHPEGACLARGRNAAIRLRRARLSFTEQEELITVLNELGLTEEATELEQVNAHRPVAPLAISTRYSSSGFQQDAIDLLMAKGQRDRAVRQLSHEIRSRAATRLAPAFSGGRPDYQTRKMLETLHGQNLAGDVVEFLKSQRRKHWKQAALFGASCEILGHFDEAKTAYLSVLTERPDEAAVRVRLYALEAEEDLDKAARHLPFLLDTPKASDGMLANLVRLFSAENDATRRFAMAEFLTGYLEKITHPGPELSTKANAFLSTLGNSYRNGSDVVLPSLFALSPPIDSEEGNKPDEVSALTRELLEKRNALYQRVCQALLSLPGHSDLAFRQLHALASAGHPNSPDLTEIAMATLDQPEKRGARPNSSILDHRSTRIDEKQHRSFISPAEFLIRQASRSADRKKVEAEILPRIKASRRMGVFRDAEDLAGMYFCEPGDFITSSRRFLNRHHRNSRLDQAFRLIIDTWKERELDVDLSELFLPHLTRSRLSVQTPSYLVDYLTIIHSREGDQECRAFLDQLMTLFIAPPGKRLDYMAKHHSQNGVSSGTPNAGIYSFLQFLELCGRKKAFFFITLDILEELDLLGSNRLPISHPGYNTASTAGSTPDEILKFLHASPYLGEPATFSVYPMTGNSQSSVFSRFINHLKNTISNEETGPDETSTVRTRLQSEPESFGRDLILAMIETTDKQPIKVYECIGNHLPAIEALPDKQKDALVSTLPLPTSGNEGQELSAVGTRARSWIQNRTEMKEAHLAERILKAKDLASAGIDPGSLQSTVGGILAKIILKNPENDSDISLALELYEKIFSLAKVEWKKGKLSLRYGRDSYHASVIGPLLAAEPNAPAKVRARLLNFLAHFLETENGRRTALNQQATSSLDSLLSAAFNEPEQQESASSGFESFDLLFRDLPGDLTCLLPGLINITSPLNDDRRRDLRNWFESETNTGSPLIPVWRKAEALIQWEVEMAEAAGKDGPPPPDFNDLLSPETAPFGPRLALAHRLWNKDHVELQKNLTGTMGSLLEQAWRAGLMVPANQIRSHLQAFNQLEVSDQWKARSRYLISAWAESHIFRHPYRNSSSSYSPSTEDLLLIVEQAAKAGAPLSGLTNRFSGSFQNTAAPVFILVEHKRFAEARKLLTLFQTTNQSIQPPANLTYDEHYATRSQEFLSTIKREELRFFGEVVFAHTFGKAMENGQADSEEDSDKRKETLEEKITPLTERFAEIEFQNNVLRERILNLLLNLPEHLGLEAELFHEPLRKIIDETTANWTLI
ncbi:MAG: tetratricopeptide repeat protein, partial [Verrucomicrobiota bacterium]